MEIDVFWIFITLLLLIIIYKCILKNWFYFSDRNLKYFRGLPFVGSFYKVIIGREALTDILQKIYLRYPNERVVGLYELGKPSFMIRDPELIKQITIKDFDHFVNHRGYINSDVDPMMGRNMLFMKDKRWREMRSIASPFFTGSKMRIMYSLLHQCNHEMIRYLQNYQCGQDGLVLEVKDLFTRCATDIIATCAFGININSVQDETNEFYRIGKTVINFSGIQAIKFMCYSAVPELMNFFRVSFIPSKSVQYFKDMVSKTIEYREQNNVYRPDMINLLIEAKRGTLKSDLVDANEKNYGYSDVPDVSDKSSNKLKCVDDDDLLAQCMAFFLAGFDSISATLSFMSYELAVNQNIQERLYNEIKQIKKKLGNQIITYEHLQEMKYLDMIISETLRIWAPLIFTDRLVNKPYVLDCGDGRKVQLNVGDSILIPIRPIHLDEKYYKNPAVFDPERFNDTNKHQIQPGTYLPFGIGPRNCIGSRFALLECKSILVELIWNFKLDKCERTPVPVVLKPNTFGVTAKDGYWLKFNKRIH